MPQFDSGDSRGVAPHVAQVVPALHVGQGGAGGPCAASLATDVGGGVEAEAAAKPRALGRARQAQGEGGAGRAAGDGTRGRGQSAAGGAAEAARVGAAGTGGFGSRPPHP